MRSKKVFIDTLGCPKNFNDSEFAAGVLEENGYEIIDLPEEADIIMVNTCGFINDAKKESIEHIFDMSERSDDGALVGRHGSTGRPTAAGLRARMGRFCH